MQFQEVYRLLGRLDVNRGLGFHRRDLARGQLGARHPVLRRRFNF
jgi:hypothetical protein